MRFKPSAPLVLLTLSSIAFSQGRTGLERITPNAGSSSGSMSLNGILGCSGDWSMALLVVVTAGIIVYNLYKNALGILGAGVGSEGGVVSTVSAALNIIAVYLIIQNKWYCNLYATVVIIVILAALGAGLSKLSERITAGSFGKKDKNLLKNDLGGLANEIGDEIKHKPEKNKPPVKEDLKDLEETEGKGTARELAKSELESSEDVAQIGKQAHSIAETTAAGGELAAINNIESNLNDKRTQAADSEVTSINNALSGVCQDVSSLSEAVKGSANTQEADAKINEWVGNTYEKMIGNLEQLNAREMDVSKYWEKVDKKKKQFSSTADKLSKKLDIQERQMGNTEKKIASAEKGSYKALSKAIAAKAKKIAETDNQIRKLEKDIGKEGKADESMINTLQEQQAREKQRLATMKNAKTMLDKQAATLNEWEGKTKAAIKKSRKDAKDIRKLAKVDKKIAEEMAKTDAQIKGKVSKEGEIIKGMKEQLQAHKSMKEGNPPEFAAIDMAKRMNDYLGATKNVLANIKDTEERLLLPSLDTLTQNVEKTASLTRRTMFVGDAQKNHALGWKYINETAKAAMEGKTVSGKHAKWENNVMNNFKRIGSNLDADKKANDITLSRLKATRDRTSKQADNIKGSAARIQSTIGRIDTEGANAIQSINQALSKTFSVNAGQFNEYQNRATAFKKEMKKEQKKLKSAAPIANKKSPAGNNVFKKGLTGGERRTGNKGVSKTNKKITKAAGVPKPPKK